MTYLQLVNRLRSECGIAGTDITTTVGQTGEMKRLCNWITQAWEELQLDRQDWDFMRKSVTFNTIANQQTYHVGTGLDIDISDFAKWKNDSVRQYLQSAGIATQIILSQYYDYTEFRDFYLLGSRTLVTGRPLYFTIEPASRAILLGFTPNDVYVTDAEYYRTPQELTADADEPIMPAQYHMAIVFKAMQKYGLYEVASEQIQAGKDGYSFYKNKLDSEYSPIIQATGSFI